MTQHFDWKAMIPDALNMIMTEEAHLDTSRANNRTAAMVVVGAVLGLALKEKSIGIAFAMAIGALTFTSLFWYQDYRLHRFRHGWHGMGGRIRRYIIGTATEEEVRLLEYDKKDEEKATFFCWSSGATFLVLVFGSIGLVIYRFLAGPVA